MDVRRRAREANAARYAGGDEVDAYLKDRYHSLRLELAVRMLDRHWHRLNGRRKDPRMVEIGAAGGATCELMRARGLGPVAADADHEALRAARARGLDAVQLDATEGLPFGDGNVDGLLAGELIEHLYDPHDFLVECARALRPDGVVVLTTPNLAAVQDRVMFLLGRSPRHVDAHHAYRRLHIRQFTHSSLRQALVRAGLRPLEVQANFVVWRRGTTRHQSRALARIWPGGGAALIAAATPMGGGKGRTTPGS